MLREHRPHDAFVGPRLLVHVAALEIHPLGSENRVEELNAAHGIGYCIITKCSTEVCPESIAITDNAMIPLKERVLHDFYDSLRKFLRVLRLGKSSGARRWRRPPSWPRTTSIVRFAAD